MLRRGSDAKPAGRRTGRGDPVLTSDSRNDLSTGAPGPGSTHQTGRRGPDRPIKRCQATSKTGPPATSKTGPPRPVAEGRGQGMGRRGCDRVPAPEEDAGRAGVSRAPRRTRRISNGCGAGCSASDESSDPAGSLPRSSRSDQRRAGRKPGGPGGRQPATPADSARRLSGRRRRSPAGRATSGRGSKPQGATGAGPEEASGDSGNGRAPDLLSRVRLPLDGHQPATGPADRGALRTRKPGAVLA